MTQMLKLSGKALKQFIILPRELKLITLKINKNIKSFSREIETILQNQVPNGNVITEKHSVCDKSFISWAQQQTWKLNRKLN